MPANVSGNAVAFPERDDLAGAEPWEMADHLEEMAWRAEVEEATCKLEASVLRTRRRMEGEKRRAASRRRSRR